MKTLPMIALMMLAGACATGPRWANGEPPALVTARLETVVTTDGQVDADDPAFWADRKNPSRAVMFGTDKTDGLYVHNMDGTVKQFFASGALNNVDLRDGFRLDGKAYVLVGASADEKLGLYTYLMDPATLETKEWGFASTGDFVPYGFCVATKNDQFYLIANSKSGEIRIWTVGPDAAGKPVTTLVRTLKVGSQPEGCVVDEETDTLYVGEEDVGIWKFGFSVGTSDTPVSVAKVDKKRITDDVEGLTIMRDGSHKYLIASSQGDDTYNVFRLANNTETYVGRFAIVDGDTIDGVTATDGVDAWSGPIGQFPEGVLGFHDDQDAPLAGQQNYKMVDWRDVRKALNLPAPQ